MAFSLSLFPVRLDLAQQAPSQACSLCEISSAEANGFLGSIAAGWQSAIGSVAAGSAFAIMQSLTMTGLLTSIGGWIIAGGITRFLSTCDWKSIVSRLIQSYLADHARVLGSTLSNIRDLRRILNRIDNLTKILSRIDDLALILSF